MADRSSFTLSHSFRVRWAECDPQGVVFNANYFLYFDIGMTEYLRVLDLQGDHAAEFFVVHSEADFRASARFDDELEIAVRCGRIGRTSMTINMAIFRGAELLTEGSLVYVHADPKTQEKAPLSSSLIDRIVAFEKTPPTQ